MMNLNLGALGVSVVQFSSRGTSSTFAENEHLAQLLTRQPERG
jgi:hypothetical protein